jgi:hypothetical protein
VAEQKVARGEPFTDPTENNAEIGNTSARVDSRNVGRPRRYRRARGNDGVWRDELLSYLPAFFAAGVACIVASAAVLTIRKRTPEAMLAVPAE